jgi:hypothetical protein
VEVADQRRTDAAGVSHALLDLGHRRGRLVDVDRNAHHLEPASASSMHCCAVARASAVSVMVIAWTTTGAPPPTWT